MLHLPRIASTLLLALSCVSCSTAQTKQNPHYSHTSNEKVNIRNSEWKDILTGEEYRIARKAGTERAFTGKYWDNKKTGNYYCAACGNLLFTSKTKFESGTGWPSFYRPADNSAVTVKQDADGFREEVLCKRCDAHLGHVFDDGPPPTGQRYCMNGNILDFKATK